MLLWEAPDGEEIAGIGAAARISASGDARFEEARLGIAQALDAAAHRGPLPDGFPGAIAVGGFSFAADEPRGGWPGFPDALFFVPERLFWRRRGGRTIETRWSVSSVGRADGDATPDPPCAARGMSRESWGAAVRATLERVHEGAISKAVLARSLDLDLGPRTDPVGILERLRSAYPGCYRFLIADGRGGVFLGASPERLVRLAEGAVSTEAVAGTIRSGPGADDEPLAIALTQSSKDRAEHEMVLRHLVDTLRPSCSSLHAPAHPGVMRLPHLFHLRTPVEGRALGNPNILDLVSRLHPTPAVAGLKREAALEWIRSAEALSRGWYAGAVGWVNARGEGDFAVGIRSLAIRGTRARVFAGAGIVAGSDPDREWEETEIKMKGILDALARR
ncbi:MAG: isochorismate synthase [Candidatus Latescibacteria bacterium]|nr:isochorismate synthase [Candidatus Latescibacterota bacterium]